MIVVRPRRPRPDWRLKYETIQTLIKQGIGLNQACAQTGVSRPSYRWYDELAHPANTFVPKAPSNSIWAQTKSNRGKKSKLTR